MALSGNQITGLGATGFPNQSYLGFAAKELAEAIVGIGLEGILSTANTVGGGILSLASSTGGGLSSKMYLSRGVNSLSDILGGGVETDTNTAGGGINSRK